MGHVITVHTILSKIDNAYLKEGFQVQLESMINSKKLR